MSRGTWILLGSGLVTSLLATFLDVLLARTADLSLYDSLAFGVVPLGAALLGVAGGTGLYASARLARLKPTRGVLVGLLGVSALAFLGRSLCGYWLVPTAEGHAAFELVSFSDYLQRSVLATTIWGGGEPATGTLGNYGLVLVGAQIVAFAGGSAFVYALLAMRPYCTTCRRFLGPPRHRQRYVTSGDPRLAELQRFIDSGHWQRALDVLEDLGQLTEPRPTDDWVQVYVTEHFCPECGGRQIEVHQAEYASDVWTREPETERSAFVVSPKGRRA